MKLPTVDDFDPHKLTEISPSWWSAVLGATAAGAILFPAHRVTAGATVGGLMLLLALYQTPCCAGCAAGVGCGGAAAAKADAGLASSSPAAGGVSAMMRTALPQSSVPDATAANTARTPTALLSAKDRGTRGGC